VQPGCTKAGNSEGTISAGGAEGADRERNRSDGARLLQVVQERDSVIEHAIEGCVDKHKWISTFPWTYAGMLKSSLANPATCSGSSERPQLLVRPRLVSASWAVPAENVGRANGLCHRS
jgi:hypothetical protein